MKVLLAGATGATGIKVTAQLLERDISVKALVRSTEKLSLLADKYPQLEIVTAGIAGLSSREIAGLMQDCDAAISCLGHNLTFKGLFGKPRRLVTDSISKLAEAATDSGRKKTRLILMNTTANKNRDLNERRSLAQMVIFGILGILLPPQADNVQAAEFLRTSIGGNHKEVEWVAVRPDTLIDLDTVTPYSVHPSPVRDPMFNPGKTSRINVAHFMAELLIDDNLWDTWKGKMPVLYNKEY